MFKLFFSITFIFLLSPSFTQDKSSDPVLRKYEGRIKRLKSEYKKSVELVRTQLIKDYKTRQNKFTKESTEIKVDIKTNKKVKSLKINILEAVTKRGISFREIEIYGEDD